MRVLLLHPQDSPLRGPWSQQRWDLIVDLGKSSPFSSSEWQARMHCPVLRSDVFRRGTEDLRVVRNMFSSLKGHLVDEEGIDWWDLTSLIVVAEAEGILVLQRLAAEIPPAAQLWATRPGWSARVMAMLLQRPLRLCGARFWDRGVRFVRLLHQFPIAQIKEIVFDKYDPGYQWRTRFAMRQPRCGEPVVLVPSAYTNVSRMAADYARVLPQQTFLMVATRQSAKQFVAPENMQQRDLAAYANADPPAKETSSLLEAWRLLQGEMRARKEFEVLAEGGVFDGFAELFSNGLRARNAWREVFEHEPVCGVLCGDDSNLYTRLPVLLAIRRKIPTVDFHHGAFDGRYLLKELQCDLYLAKNEMERDYLLRVCGLPDGKVVVGAPWAEDVGVNDDRGLRGSVVFFSEPYEVRGMRTAEVYREILPLMCRVARDNGRDVIVKLHPFESCAQRSRLVRDALTTEDRKFVRLMDGPLTNELMARAWFGITVESTTVVDCLKSGIPCFLCAWLAPGSYEYVQQYARFGVGEVLQDARQIAEIPSRLEGFRPLQARPDLSTAVDPAILQRWLTGSYESHSARPAL